MVESLFFIGAGAGADEKKILGAGQKWTGSATLLLVEILGWIRIR